MIAVAPVFIKTVTEPSVIRSDSAKAGAAKANSRAIAAMMLLRRIINVFLLGKSHNVQCNIVIASRTWMFICSRNSISIH
jgi:hypothetical protein